MTEGLTQWTLALKGSAYVLYKQTLFEVKGAD